MYSNNYAFVVLYLHVFTYRATVLFLHLGYLIHNIDRCLFFRRLKINHDTHELILESVTVTNKCQLATNSFWTELYLY
jgi:hypothetical protein